MPKKFYAVKKGRKVGVYESWEECKKQVDGYPGAIYKGFSSLDEANTFITGEKNTFVKKGDSSKEYLDISEKEIIAYVDGSYNISTSEVGFGVVLLGKDFEKKISDKVKDSSVSEQRNVAGEIFGSMTAIKEAINLGYKKIYIHHDYTGLAEWATGVWKTNIDLTKSYKQFIESVTDKIDIEFVKVKAHSGDKYNDIADRLAKDAIGIE